MKISGKILILAGCLVFALAAPQQARAAPTCNVWNAVEYDGSTIRICDPDAFLWITVAKIANNGDITFPASNAPVSKFHVPDGYYLQIGEIYKSSPPASTDCDQDSELGRYAMAKQTHMLYICGGSLGWQEIALVQ